MTKFSLAAFQEACRSAGPLTFDVERAAQGAQRIRLNQPFAILGAHAEAHVRWQDPLLNKRHAYLQVIGGSVFGIDLGSRSGTRWGEEPRSCGWIDGAQPLVLGSTMLRLASPLGGSEPSLNPLAPQAMTGSTLWHLEITAGQQRPTYWTANRALFLIGKSELCKVRLHSPEISRFHASVVSTPAGMWIVDLLSRSGVFVNGRRVQVARLEPGDQLRIGRFLIRLHEQPAAVSNVARGSEPLYPAVDIPGALQTVPAVGGILTPGAASLPSAALNGASHAMMEAVVLPLMREFSCMQQQMFDNFQQNLMAMFQMFQVSQREHLDVVREELAKIQEITLKVNVLQAELGQLRAGAAAGDGSGLREREQKPGEPAPLRAPPTAPARTPAWAAAGSPALDQQSQAPAGEEPSGEEPCPNGAGPTIPLSSPSPEHLHASLCERLAGLQQERQTRWQKIMTFLVGK